MNQKTTRIVTRLAVFAVSFSVFGSCFYVLQTKANPLARYPYGNDAQRAVLESRLDQEQIDYLINAQILPEMILPYIDDEDFDVKNTVFYHTAYSIRPAEISQIVDFVNTYRDYFSLDQLSLWLSWLDYESLAAYFDSGIRTPLADNAEDPNLVLNGSATVYTWAPSDLMSVTDGIVLRQEAAVAWTELKEAAQDAQIELQGLSGYVAYDQQWKENEYRSFVRGSFGSREEQLGTTVAVNGFDEWNKALSLSSKDNSGSAQYERAMDALSTEQQASAAWLAENAWKYGWVIRYPEDSESSQYTTYQPFVLRYVGKEQAQIMQENGWSLEEWNENSSVNTDGN
jgi:D-alanyl-D-alanine carboxypeptidase